MSSKSKEGGDNNRSGEEDRHQLPFQEGLMNTLMPPHPLLLPHWTTDVLSPETYQHQLMAAMAQPLYQPAMLAKDMTRYFMELNHIGAQHHMQQTYSFLTPPANSGKYKSGEHSNRKWGGLSNAMTSSSDRAGLSSGGSSDRPISQSSSEASLSNAKSNENPPVSPPMDLRRRLSQDSNCSSRKKSSESDVDVTEQQQVEKSQSSVHQQEEIVKSVVSVGLGLAANEVSLSSVSHKSTEVSCSSLEVINKPVEPEKPTYMTKKQRILGTRRPSQADPPAPQVSTFPVSSASTSSSLSPVKPSSVNDTVAPVSGAPVSGVPVSGALVSGVPASGVPASGVPASGVPVSGVPVSGVTVSGVAASGVPVSGVPVSGVPVSGVPVSGVPVSGVPVSGVPTSGVPTSGVPTSGVPTSGVPTSGVPTSGVPTSGVPASGVPTSGVPTSGVPTSGVPAVEDSMEKPVSTTAKSSAVVSENKTILSIANKPLKHKKKDWLQRNSIANIPYKISGGSSSVRSMCNFIGYTREGFTTSSSPEKGPNRNPKVSSRKNKSCPQRRYSLRKREKEDKSTVVHKEKANCESAINVDISSNNNCEAEKSSSGSLLTHDIDERITQEARIVLQRLPCEESQDKISEIVKKEAQEGQLKVSKNELFVKDDTANSDSATKQYVPIMKIVLKSDTKKNKKSKKSRKAKRKHENGSDLNYEIQSVERTDIYTDDEYKEKEKELKEMEEMLKKELLEAKAKKCENSIDRKRKAIKESKCVQSGKESDIQNQDKGFESTQQETESEPEVKAFDSDCPNSDSKVKESSDAIDKITLKNKTVQDSEDSDSGDLVIDVDFANDRSVACVEKSIKPSHEGTHLNDVVATDSDSGKFSDEGTTDTANLEHCKERKTKASEQEVPKNVVDKNKSQDKSNSQLSSVSKIPPLKPINGIHARRAVLGSKYEMDISQLNASASENGQKMEIPVRDSDKEVKSDISCDQISKPLPVRKKEKEKEKTPTLILDVAAKVVSVENEAASVEAGDSLLTSDVINITIKDKTKGIVSDTTLVKDGRCLRQRPQSSQKGDQIGDQKSDSNSCAQTSDQYAASKSVGKLKDRYATKLRGRENKKVKAHDRHSSKLTKDKSNKDKRKLSKSSGSSKVEKSVSSKVLSPNPQSDLPHVDEKECITTKVVTELQDGIKICISQPPLLSLENNSDTNMDQLAKDEALAQQLSSYFSCAPYGGLKRRHSREGEISPSKPNHKDAGIPQISPEEHLPVRKRHRKSEYAKLSSASRPAEALGEDKTLPPMNSSLKSQNGPLNSSSSLPISPTPISMRSLDSISCSVSPPNLDSFSPSESEICTNQDLDFPRLDRLAELDSRSGARMCTVEKAKRAENKEKDINTSADEIDHSGLSIVEDSEKEKEAFAENLKSKLSKNEILPKESSEVCEVESKLTTSEDRQAKDKDTQEEADEAGLLGKRHAKGEHIDKEITKKMKPKKLCEKHEVQQPMEDEKSILHDTSDLATSVLPSEGNSDLEIKSSAKEISTNLDSPKEKNSKPHNKCETKSIEAQKVTAISENGELRKKIVKVRSKTAKTVHNNAAEEDISEPDKEIEKREPEVRVSLRGRKQKVINYNEEALLKEAELDFEERAPAPKLPPCPPSLAPPNLSQLQHEIVCPDAESDDEPSAPIFRPSDVKNKKMKPPLPVKKTAAVDRAESCHNKENGELKSPVALTFGEKAQKMLTRKTEISPNSMLFLPTPDKTSGNSARRNKFFKSRHDDVERSPLQAVLSPPDSQTSMTPQSQLGMFSPRHHSTPSHASPRSSLQSPHQVPIAAKAVSRLPVYSHINLENENDPFDDPYAFPDDGKKLVKSAKQRLMSRKAQPVKSKVEFLDKKSLEKPKRKPRRPKASKPNNALNLESFPPYPVAINKDLAPELALTVFGEDGRVPPILTVASPNSLAEPLLSPSNAIPSLPASKAGQLKKDADAESEVVRGHQASKRGSNKSSVRHKEICKPPKESSAGPKRISSRTSKPPERLNYRHEDESKSAESSGSEGDQVEMDNDEWIKRYRKLVPTVVRISSPVAQVTSAQENSFLDEASSGDDNTPANYHHPIKIRLKLPRPSTPPCSEESEAYDSDSEYDDSVESEPPYNRCFLPVPCEDECSCFRHEALSEVLSKLSQLPSVPAPVSKRTSILAIPEDLEALQAVTPTNLLFHKSLFHEESARSYAKLVPTTPSQNEVENAKDCFMLLPGPTDCELELLSPRDESLPQHSVLYTCMCGQVLKDHASFEQHEAFCAGVPSYVS